MALRSLPVKLKGFLRARAAAYPPASAAVASSMISVKHINTEAWIRAILREQQRLEDEKVKNEIRKLNKSIGVVVAASVGVVAFAWSSTMKAIEERRRKHMVFQERMAAIMGDDYEPICTLGDAFAYIMDELGTDTMDAKRRVTRANVMDAKRILAGGNVMDAKEKSSQWMHRREGEDEGVNCRSIAGSDPYMCCF